MANNNAPEIMKKIEKWSVPEPNTGCWLWEGMVENDKYPRVWLNGKNIQVRPLVYRLTRIDIPVGTTLWWRCGNYLCVNPHHGYLPTVTDRFLSEVSKTDGCWVWTGLADHHGYGRFYRGSHSTPMMQAAHRASYELFCGPIPEGLDVLHRCDNPPCVRPDHLYAGTHSQNMLDCYQRSNRSRRRKLTEQQVKEILTHRNSIHPHALAKELKVSPAAIYRILSGDNWKEYSRNIS
jgi:hypothetical protein